MNMRVMLKFLGIFWGIVLFIVLIKIIINVLPTSFDFLPSITWEKEDKESIRIPLKKQYGFTIEDAKTCTSPSQDALNKNGLKYAMSSHCWNGVCSIDITFSDDIPETFSLYIENNKPCHLEHVRVPKPLDAVGYILDLKLTDEQKIKLGISEVNKIRLKRANGHTIDSKQQLYFYDKPIAHDTLLIDNKKIGEIYFSDKTISQQSHTSSPQLENTVSAIPEIDIPHPKDLYTYTCNDTTCEKVSNTYVVNVDGVDFIPSSHFIASCSIDVKSSVYCIFLTQKGTVSNLQKFSPQFLQTLRRFAKNPEFNDDLQAWEKERFEKAQEKIEASIVSINY